MLVQEGGERSFLTDPGGSLRKLGPEHLTFPFEEAIDILSFASIFVSPRFGAAEMEKLFCRAKEQGILVCADMTKPKNGEQEKEAGGIGRDVFEVKCFTIKMSPILSNARKLEKKPDWWYSMYLRYKQL